ncbi:hypothetical protein [Klebsiella phage PhiKpNIH-6]|uniref:Uncharacterized protein n=1 Tax=Klebsiella phage PhiKpNIH-6 TaxID=2689112 RepID=A0A6B9LQ65_9CAUD|nr:hypothetical protein [Klebsiella phage PhiKpNIH-6]
MTSGCIQVIRAEKKGFSEMGTLSGINRSIFVGFLSQRCALGGYVNNPYSKGK